MSGMAVGSRSLLFIVGVLALIPLSDPSLGANRRVYQQCEKVISGCGEFQPPSNNGARLYSCKFHKKTCRFLCTVKCQRGPDNKRMKISNRRHARELYECHGDKWVRRDDLQAYCHAAVTVPTVRQNLHHIGHLNDLANRLMNSSFVYLAMASFFERADVALPGFSKLMTDLWQHNMKHSRDMMTYVNTRGGFINLKTIPRPSSHEDLLMYLGKRTGLAGISTALGETKDVNEQALEAHALSMEQKRYADPHMKFFLEDGVLNYHVETIKKLADLESQLKSFDNDEDYMIGEYSIDLKLRE